MPRREPKLEGLESVSDIPFILAGFLVGAMHVLLGPEHLAALAPFAVEARREAWVIGLRWGVGHALGIIVVGLVGYALIDWLDVELLSGLSERLVGLVLIAIGIWSFAHLRTARFPRSEANHVRAGVAGHVHTRAAFLVGALHGVAGTGNLLGVLPAMAQPSWIYAGAYLVSFGTGSLLGMVAFASLFALAAPAEESSAQATYRWVFIAAGVTCFAMGVLWVLFPGLRFGLDGGV